MSYEDEVAALVIHKTEPDDSGVYSIQAENPLGQVKSEGNLAVHSEFIFTMKIAIEVSHAAPDFCGTKFSLFHQVKIL